ncbi:hypothetical protein IscW_ISCW004769 [Ixodes scapularis]|uniref:Uncharacterized protein n=1 Tax=Ixodes scapularis TaxID=6945 RepID=B7PEN8_IXOSC|nr:hypothetical protein IscW_ISCW004769 [Ixodes scapularis]|eukprot:XP_002433660.1 hypothetical protein IscW_ISCW004769 [Ixodes scapularis]
MASATLLKEAAVTTKATNACMQFAGLRTGKFTSEMHETFKRDKGRTTFHHTVQGAEAALSAYFNHVRGLLDDKKYSAGNVKCRSVTDLTLTDNGTEVEEWPQKTGKIFWSN